MSYFMAYTQQRPDGEVQAAIELAKSKAIQEFSNQQFQGEYPDTGYGIVAMRPYHIQAGGTAWGSSNYWASSYAASVTWEAWINITQTELLFEILCGMWNYEAVPKTVEIYVTADGRDFPTINIEEMYAYDVARIFWKKPLVISPKKNWAFYHKGTNTGVEREGILGYTLGTRSYLIKRG